MLSQFCNVKPLNIHAPRVSLMFITRSFVMHAQMRLGFICNHYIVVSQIAKKKSTIDQNSHVESTRFIRNRKHK